jgi:hypothetical protein
VPRSVHTVWSQTGLIKTKTAHSTGSQMSELPAIFDRIFPASSSDLRRR